MVEVPTRDLVLALLLAVVVACALTLVAIITAVMKSRECSQEIHFHSSQVFKHVFSLLSSVMYDGYGIGAYSWEERSRCEGD